MFKKIFLFVCCDMRVKQFQSDKTQIIKQLQQGKAFYSPHVRKVAKENYCVAQTPLQKWGEENIILQEIQQKKQKKT